MKESFSELYARLYRENFEELEQHRAKQRKNGIGIIFITIAMFLLFAINPFFTMTIIISLFGYAIYKGLTVKRKDFKVEPRGKTYTELFKEKVVGPIIENTFESAKYNPKEGILGIDYRKAGYNERYDRYHSEDLVIATLKNEQEVSSFITFAEVCTQKESRDSDGNTTYVTMFHGLAGSFLIPKDIDKSIYIRSNGRVSNWNKNKVKMDVPEFEKIFDVESEDPILAMRILTADVMSEMIDLYKKYKYSFEINIINDTVYMRLKTGPMFEPNIFQNSMEYKTLEKYYLVLKALTSIAEHMYNTILKLDI